MGLSAVSRLELSPEELVSLYLRLKPSECELDAAATAVFERLRSLLYGGLSIDEMEHLEEYYGILLAASVPGRR